MHQFSICILRLSSLGDIILTTPLIRSIRKAFPDACIDMIIADHFAEVIQNNPHINSVLTINTKSGMIHFFKQILSIRKDKPKYDIIIDIHDSIRSKIIRFYL
jgi:ADP-heptose:LPS heptosyltransferase